MPTFVAPDGIALYYETFGGADAPPLLLVAGLGAQSINWSDGFCQYLADGGRYVIRFDNRDVGLSSILDDAPSDVGAARVAIAAGDMEKARSLVPYTLVDMARDATHVLDHLGIDEAHVVGASMGGMIAQTMAIHFPERCTTLTSIMSTTGEAHYGQATPEALTVLVTPRPPEREAFIEGATASMVWLSKRYADPAQIRRDAAAAYDRSFTPQGVVRQMAAIAVSGSRAEGLRRLRVPTLVIHGLDDTLIHPSGGERTAELVPNAQLVLLEDMGHDRPEPLWPAICGAILTHSELV